jgi:glycosyltransferase involved in cell wall biosynthesis
MKILHIYKDYHPIVGGIENHIRWLAEAQAQRGHEVTVLVTSRDRRTTWSIENGVRVIRGARLAHVASTPLSLSLPLLLRRQRPDIAHLHYPYPPGELSQLLLGRSRRTIITYHSDVVRQQRGLRLYGPMQDRVFRQADVILPTSLQYANSSSFLRRWLGKCRIIPLGIPLERFLGPADERRTADIRGSIGTPLLLFVGALRYYKGLQHLIEALCRVPHAHLVIVGDGPMRQEWMTAASNAGMRDRVHFVGPVDDQSLPAYYLACDLFVLPSTLRAEAFGTSLVEAMASGRAVVSTELGTGTSYVNLHGQTGLVVPPGDPGALADAINHLLSDGALRETMGHAARVRALAEFGLELMVERVLAVYKEMLREPAFGHHPQVE